MNPIETVAIDTLTPHPQNPRRGNIDAIAESIRTNGWWGVIVAQTSTRHVLAGNHRLQAARLAGLDTVPVHWLDVPDDVALRVLLADNRSGDQAGYDDDSLAELLAAIRDETGTLDGTLFTSDDLDQLLADLAPLAAVEASDDAPAVPAEAKTRPGDVFDLGPHRLVCGDVLAPGVLDALLGDDEVDMIATDPPYSSGGAFRGDRQKSTRAKYVQTNAKHDTPDFTGDTRDQRAYLAWSTLWISACMERLRPGRIALVFADWRQLPVTTDALQAAGAMWRGVFTWTKPGARPNLGFSNSCEYAAWGTKGPIDLGTDVYLAGSVEEGSVKGDDKAHQTQKPVGVIAHIISACEQGGIVLDPFGGSGTTLIACDSSGRRARLVELSPAYCDVIRQRYADHANRPDLAP